MAAGCQKLQNVINPDDGLVNEDGQVAIRFKTNVANVETKGVGSLETLGTNNTLYIYGLNNTHSGVQEFKNSPAHAEGNNLVFNAVDHDDNPSTPDKAPTYFYAGTTDKYSFYGYYVDDACGAGVTPAPGADYKLNVTIDGTQDILLGAAIPDEDVDGNAEVAVADVYSAYSARRGVTPNIVFNHALTRYTFTLLNKGTQPVKVEKVEVMSKTKGVLTVAGAQELTLDGTETADSPLELESDDLPKSLGSYVKEGDVDNDGQPMTPSAPVALDGSVMTFAGQANTLVLTLSQEGMLDSEQRVVSMPIKVTGGTLAAYSYELAVVVYSLEKVGMTVTLKDWITGESIGLDPEDSNSFDEGEVVDDIVNRPATDDNDDAEDDNDEEEGGEELE